MLNRHKAMSIRKDNPLYRAFLPIKVFIERHLIQNRRNMLLLFGAIALSLYAGVKFKRLFFITFLSTLGSVSMIYLRYFPELYVLGVEFCMLATVLCAKAYGPATGALVGFVTITLATILSGRFKPSSFISVMALPIVGLIAGMLDLNITLLGVSMTILYDAIIIPLYILLGSRVPSSIIFFVSHVFFNYWAFSTLGPIILGWMA